MGDSTKCAGCDAVMDTTKPSTSITIGQGETVYACSAACTGKVFSGERAKVSAKREQELSEPTGAEAAASTGTHPLMRERPVRRAFAPKTPLQ
jgi:hypothetical protein